MHSITVTAGIGSSDGKIKTENCGLQHFGKDPVCATIFDEMYDELQLNMYDDFSDYLEFLQKINIDTERLLV